MTKRTVDRARPRIRKGPDERREQILACARGLFSERPYEDVSNTEIAAAAGVSRGLLNHYFGTKRELYLAAVAEMLNVPPLPVPSFVAGMSVRDRIAQSIDGWLELLELNQETWLTAMDMSGAGGDEELERLLDAARDRSVGHIIEVVGLGPLAADHPEVHSVLRGFSGMAEATSREWLKRGRLTREQAQFVLVETTMHLVADVIPGIVSGERS